MPYKDSEKSKEAAAERQRKHRQGVTKEGVTEQGVTVEMMPELVEAIGLLQTGIHWLQFTIGFGLLFIMFAILRLR